MGSLKIRNKSLYGALNWLHKHGFRNVTSETIRKGGIHEPEDIYGNGRIAA